EPPPLHLRRRPARVPGRGPCREHRGGRRASAPGVRTSSRGSREAAEIPGVGQRAYPDLVGIFHFFTVSYDTYFRTTATPVLGPSGARANLCRDGVRCNVPRSGPTPHTEAHDDA